MPDDFDAAADGAFDEQPAEPEPEEAQLGEEEAAEEAPATGEEAAPTEEAAPEQPAEPWRSSLRAGETPEQAIPRLVGHIQRYKSDIEEIRREQAEQAPKLAAAEKILAALQHKQEMEELSAREAGLPDPELEPERAVLVEVQRLRQEIEDAKRRSLEAEQQQLTEAQQREQQERVQAVDDAATRDILAGLGLVEGVEADPEFVDAFNYQEAARWQAITSEYGEELAQLPPEEAQQLALAAMELMRRVDGRKAAAVGRPIRDLVLTRYRAVPESVRQAMKAHLEAQSAAAGNGKPTRNGNGKPTAAQIEAQATAAARGAGVRRTRGSGSVAAPATLDDFLDLPEEDQAKLLASGKASEEDIWEALADQDFAGM